MPSLFFFIPGIKELLVMMLEITGDTSLYNYHMLQILFSLPGIAAIILLLPFQDLYLAPSVMPHLGIPNFITGELSKQWYGDFVLDLAYALLFVLFLLLLFLLPLMILKGKSFRKSCKESIFTWKKAGIKGVQNPVSCQEIFPLL